MAKIRLKDNMYVPRGYQIGDQFNPAPWASALQTKGERALEISAYLRSQRIAATAIADSGGDSLEPAPASAPVVESQSFSWRGIIPKRITATLWGYVWRDAIDDVTHSVTGADSAEVLMKLKTIQHPVYQRLRDSLPPEHPLPGAPTFRQPIPEGPRDANGRVLRPADNRAHTLPERRLETGPIVREDFAVWEKTATAAQYQERCKTDPAFLAWTNQVAR